VKQLWVALAVATLVLAASRTAHARGCHEVSDIVGYEKCNRFGNGWAVDRRPPLFVGLGFGHMLFDPNGVTFSQVRPRGVPADSTNDAQFDGSALGVGGLGTTALDFRVGGYFLGPLYLGVESQWGFGNNQFSTVSANGRTFAAASSFNTDMFSMGALLGVRLPLGRLSLRLEGYGGFRDVTVSADSGSDNVSFQADRGILETRALVDVWVTPNVTLTVYGGTDALDTRQDTMGLTIELHGRSFDGAFALW
jgi:hypothetical protein